MVIVTHKDKVHTLTFIVVPKNVKPIPGLYACKGLNLAKRVLVAEVDDYTNYDDLMKKYSDLFQALGSLPGEHTIRLNNSVPPVIHPFRKVLCALRKPLKDELDQMEKLEVIEKIDEPTEWVSSLVIVETVKSVHGSQRSKYSNTRRTFQAPHKRRNNSQFANAKYFSKLYAASGFWQLKLDDASSKSRIFHSPFGRYRFR